MASRRFKYDGPGGDVDAYYGWFFEEFSNKIQQGPYVIGNELWQLHFPLAQ